MPCDALSFERTAWSAVLRSAVGEFCEPPKRSQCRSCMTAASNGPPSHLRPNDHTCGCRVEVSVSSVEYCAAPEKPMISGVSYCTAFARRRWKLDALLVPKPTLRSTLLEDTKLPLEMPR